MTSLRAVAALILAVTILQLAGGLLGVLIPLAMTADHLSEAGVGLVGALYFAGFMAGAWFAPTLLSRVGHIRVFAASAAFAAIAVLCAFWASDALSWALVRILQGGALALMFAAIESWMYSSIKSQERGAVMGFYLVCTKLPLALGPFLFEGYGSAAPESFMIAAGCFALCLVPVCFTRTVAPEPPKAQPLAIAEQYRAAPAAVTAAFGAGLINSSVLFFSPLYAEQRFGEDRVAEFVAAAWLGSLVLQWPAGRLSDRLDRRLVIAALSGVAALAALTLAAFGGVLPFAASTALFAIWGAGALSFYGLAVAHMADRAEPSQLARATAGLLFVWAVGALFGPALAGLFVEGLGRDALFYFAGVLGLATTGLMFWRRAARASLAPAEKEPYKSNSAASPSAATLAYGEPEQTPK